MTAMMAKGPHWTPTLTLTQQMTSLSPNLHASSKEKIDSLLYKKFTKTVHHLEFLKECRKERRVPKRLQLRLKLNVVNQTKELEAKIQGILIQAELEVMNEIMKH